jgi:hypothetical protein
MANSGLGSLAQASTVKPSTSGNLETVNPSAAALDSPDSTGILNNMQKMLDEYNSPSHIFQNTMDRALAYTRYDPTEALRSVNEQEQQETANKYNISQNLANVNLLRQQLNDVAGGFQGTLSKAAPGTSDDTASGVTFKGVPLSVYEYQTLENYRKTGDLSGFNSAFKAISDIHSKAQAESAENPAWTDRISINVTGKNPSGQTVTHSVNVSKKEAHDWETKRILPAILHGYIQDPNEEKKAAGGSVQHLADGGQPLPVDASQAQPQPAAVQPPSPAMPQAGTAPVVPGSGIQGGFLDQALSALMGNAEAAPPTQQGHVTVSAGPKIDYSLNPEFAKIGTESGLRQGEDANKTDLDLAKEEIKHYGELAVSAKDGDLDTMLDLLHTSDAHPNIYAQGRQGKISRLISSLGEQSAIDKDGHKVTLKDPGDVAASFLSNEDRAAYDTAKSMSTKAGLAMAKQNLLPGSKESVAEIQNSLKAKGVGLENQYASARPIIVENVGKTLHNIQYFQGWEDWQKSHGSTPQSYREYKKSSFVTTELPNRVRDVVTKMNDPKFVFVKPGTIENGHKFIGQITDNGADPKFWQKVK